MSPPTAAAATRRLSSLTGEPLKSLDRMFGPGTNSEARTLIELISRIRQHGNPQIKVNTVL